MAEPDQTFSVASIVSARRGRHWLLLIALWASVAVGYFSVRSRTIPVWDDTTIISAARFDDGSQKLKSAYADEGWLGLTRHAFGSGFTSAGYRPLILLQRGLFVGLLEGSRTDCQTHVRFGYALGGVCLGAVAVSFFLVARRFTETEAGALFAVFLLLFSPPIVVGAWPTLFNIQSVVPLLICVALLLYWRVVERRPYPKLAALGLCLVMLIGPWYREFLGIVPVLVLSLEWQHRRRPTWLSGLALLGLLHAIFPMALVKGLIFPEVPLRSVFAMGHLSAAISETATVGDEMSWLSRHWNGIKWHAPWNFLVLFPPMLLGLACAASLLDSRVRARSRTSTSEDGLQPARQSGAWKSRLWLVATVGFPAVTIVLWTISSEMLGLWLALGIAIVACRWSPFLAVWFLLSFLPFLKAYTEQVHFAYAVLPASIVVSVAVENLYRRLRGDSHICKVLRPAVAVVLLATAGDHTLNWYGSFRVVTTMNDGMAQLAKWFRHSVPQGSIVICNALHAEDVRWLADGHFTTYFTVDAGIPHPAKSLRRAEQLQQLLRRNNGHSKVYFLDVNYEFTPEKVAYHSHRYVHGGSVEMQDLGVIHTTRAQYPYLDPLKGVVPRRFVSFLGAPDLVNDVYRGPARDGRPFHNEIFAEYRVYRVTGSNVTEPWTPDAPLTMVREGYRGYNILECNKRYFGTPQSAGAFDVHRVWRRGCHTCLTGTSLKEVQVLIDRRIEADPESVELVVEGVQGFNIVRYGGRFFGLAQSEGAFDVGRARRGRYARCVEAESVAEVREKIQQLLARPEPAGITLLEQGYRGFNIVAYGDRIYGIGQEEGEFKIEKVRQNGYRRLVRGQSAEDVKQRIDAVLRTAEREKETR